MNCLKRSFTSDLMKYAEAAKNRRTMDFGIPLEWLNVSWWLALFAKPPTYPI